MAAVAKRAPAAAPRAAPRATPRSAPRSAPRAAPRAPVAAAAKRIATPTEKAAALAQGKRQVPFAKRIFSKAGELRRDMARTQAKAVMGTGVIQFPVFVISDDDDEDDHAQGADGDEEDEAAAATAASDDDDADDDDDEDAAADALPARHRPQIL